MIDEHMTIDDMIDTLLDQDIAEEKELRTALCLCGFSKITCQRVLYINTGYRTFESYMNAD